LAFGRDWEIHCELALEWVERCKGWAREIFDYGVQGTILLTITTLGEKWPAWSMFGLCYAKQGCMWCMRLGKGFIRKVESRV
jgi:hypothetical protein